MDDNPRLQMTPFIARERPVEVKKEALPAAVEHTERSVTERVRSGVRRSMQPLRRPNEKARTKTRAEEEDNRKTVRLLAKLGACAGILVLLLLVKAIDTPLTNMFTQNVKTALTTQTDVDEVLGKLKFVDSGQSASVFGTEIAFVLPVNGAIRGNFNENGRKGIELLANPSSDVVACADGIVVAVGLDESMGNFVRIQHAQQLETYCYGIAGICVEEGQPLKKGDVLGRVQENGIINMELYVGGKPQDPRALIERASKQ